MTPTVDEYRNEIRVAVDRFERPDSMAFTKETLAALCEAVDYDIDTGRLPSKARMRGGILWKVDAVDHDDPDEVDRQFRKTELETIANTLTAD